MDENWFKDTYNISNSINPIAYYLKHSIEKELNPSKDFNTTWYLKEYEDVKKSGINPLVHYIRHGCKEYRLTKPLITKNDDKFSLINYDYNPCFFKNNKSYINQNELNIAIFIKNDIDNLLPTEYVRLVIPFYHLFLKKNFSPFILHNEDLQRLDLTYFDLILVQRDALNRTNTENLINISKTHNIPLIYEIDDDLINIDETHPNYTEYNEKKETIECLILNANLVIVSSNKLKQKLYKLNTHIKVIKNSFNDMLKLKNESKKDYNIIKIGYMGTLTHKNDVKIVEKAIENVKKYFKKKKKKIVFENIGITDDKISCANTINIPFKYSKYPYFIRWLKRIVNWDIGIAPLENNNINQSKSEIKYLEYSSLGVAGIYSNIGAYGESIKNNKNGILIKNNTSEEWQSALITLIENENLRKEIVKNAMEDIEYNYSIDSIVTSWEEIIETFVNTKKKIFNQKPLKLLLNPSFNNDYNIISKAKLINTSEYPVNCETPIFHYLKVGVFEGINPSKYFNTAEYIKNFDIDISKTNPLVHFIKNFIYKFEYTYFTDETMENIYHNLENTITIIIPIFNAYEDVKRCIESVLKYSTKKYELILINDASTDERIFNLLNNLNGPNIKILNNNDNLGFTKSINIGFKHSSNDVIILNSDTIVTPKWIEKLTIAAYSDEKIATVTPFSNNAGVFSVPKMNKKNYIPNNLGINGMANIIEKISNHEYMRIPTGNGFCMYIKRDTLNSIGYFDDTTFKKGYGEENDFCMRAKNNGWKNILDDATFIYHNAHSSFGNEKNELIKKHTKKLIKRYPTYENEVNNFIKSKQLNEMQKNIFNALNSNFANKKRILYISKTKDIDTNEKYENFLLYITEDSVNLYYLINKDLFKIKGFHSKNLQKICFNVIINLEINEIICYKNFYKFNQILMQ